MAANIPVLSREYIWVPVTAVGEDADQLTSLPVQFAFLATRGTEPVDADWHSGGWATTASSPTARCLVGPGSAVVLDAGTYYVWLRISGATERPVRLAGQLKIS